MVLTHALSEFPWITVTQGLSKRHFCGARGVWRTISDTLREISILLMEELGLPQRVLAPYVLHHSFWKCVRVWMRGSLVVHDLPSFF